MCCDKCANQQLETLALPERYIVSKCHRLVEDVTQGLQGYDMGDAGKNIYEFLWDEYADWCAMDDVVVCGRGALKKQRDGPIDWLIDGWID